jgi:hypothetical protein
MWGLQWAKRHWGRFSPSTLVSPANHSTNFSIVILTRGWHNRPIDGRSAKWTQLDSTPTIPIKKKALRMSAEENARIVEEIMNSASRQCTSSQRPRGEAVFSR